MRVGVSRVSALAALASCAFVIGLAAPAGAQSYGIRGGINVATEHSSYPDGATILVVATKPDIRPVGGAFMGTDDRIPVGIHVELLYDEVGIRIRQTNTPVRYTYITIPVLAKARLTHRGFFRAHLVGGPAFSGLVEARQGTGAAAQDLSNVDKVSIGLTVGTILTIGQLLIDTRYTWGLTNTIENPPPDFKTTRRVFAVTLGVQFGE
jgi:hypothetical protein